VLARVDFATAREIALLVTDLLRRKRSIRCTSSSANQDVMTPNLWSQSFCRSEAVRADEESAAEKESAQVELHLRTWPEEQLLGKLLPRYIETQLLRACSIFRGGATRRA